MVATLYSGAVLQSLKDSLIPCVSRLIRVGLLIMASSIKTLFTSHGWFEALQPRCQCHPKTLNYSQPSVARHIITQSNLMWRHSHGVRPSSLPLERIHSIIHQQRFIFWFPSWLCTHLRESRISPPTHRDVSSYLLAPALCVKTPLPPNSFLAPSSLS